MSDDTAKASQPDLSDPAAAAGPSVLITQSQRPVLPLLVLLDLSSSMAEHTDAMHAAATAVLDTAWGNALGPSAAQVAVIAAGGAAQVLVPLGPITDPGDLPPLHADGLADLDGAMQLIGDEYDRMQLEALGHGRTVLRPWVLLLSDGRWQRGDAAAAITRLHAPPTTPVVCPVGIGNVDETTLARVATDVGYAVDTPSDLEAVVRALVEQVVAAGGSDTAVHRSVAPHGSRPLEGW